MPAQAPAATPPPTLPADFSGFDDAPKPKAAAAKPKPPATLPANFNGFDDAAPSATATPNQFAPLLAKHGLPPNVDLSKSFMEQPSDVKVDPLAFSRAYAEAHPQPAPPTSFFGRAWDEAKGIVGGLTAPPDTAFGTLFNPVESARSAAHAVAARATEFREHPAAAAGATATDIGAAALPFVAHEAIGRVNTALEPRRIAKGTELTKKGLGIPAPPEATELAGKQAPDAVNLARDLDIAQKDLAQVERTLADKRVPKGSGGTFVRAQAMREHAAQLWEEGHAAPISRNIGVLNTEGGFSPRDLVKAGTDAMPQSAIDAAPSGAAQARRMTNWLNNVVSKPRSLGELDAWLRDLNADLEAPAAGKPYGPLEYRVQGAVRDAVRKQIEGILVSKGETGVAAVNQRYGAIQNIADRAIEQGVSEARAEGKKGFIPDWVNTYLFVHHGGASGGVSLHPGALPVFQSKPSAQIAKGMGKLARTDLKPPPISAGAPPEWMSATGGPTTTEFTGGAEGPPNLGTRGQGGVRIAGMLPAPPTSGAPPPVQPKFATEATGTVQPLATGPGQPAPVYRGPLRPPTPRGLPALPERTGMAPPTGIVGSTFRQLGLTDLVTPRQQTTLETMMRGPRWRDMDALEKHDAIRTILNGGK